MIAPETSLEDVCNHFNVSRETSEKLHIYSDLLVKWNKSINLVSKTTLDQSAVRHFADSMQLQRFGDGSKNWMDIGSGAGFPGMVMAILRSELSEPVTFHLVESDARKSAFLRNVSRETQTPVKVHTKRVEAITDVKAGVVSARALASLTQLFEYTENLLVPDGICLYLKGQNCESEVEEASRNWTFVFEKFASETDANGTILRIRNITRVS